MLERRHSVGSRVQAATGRLTAANVPVASSNRGYIVNDLPVHPTWKAFSRFKMVGNGLVVFAPGYSALNRAEVGPQVLEHCGVSVGAVGLQSSAAAVAEVEPATEAAAVLTAERR